MVAPTRLAVLGANPGVRSSGPYAPGSVLPVLACHTIHRVDVQRSDTPASRRTGHELPEDRRGVHPQIVTISVDTSCKPTSSAIRTRVRPASKPSACQARPAVPSPKKTGHFWVSLASSGQAGISKGGYIFHGP